MQRTILLLLLALTACTKAPAPVAQPAGPVLLGIEVLTRDGFDVLRGKNIGIVTNPTGVDSQYRRTVDLIHDAPQVDVVRLFSPEHGWEGGLEGKVGDVTDGKTGLPVFSLYGDTRRPTPEMLEGLDAVVFDIQDAGTRFYTYITTLGYLMEECARGGVGVVVLDRPNPIAPLGATGPTVDEDRLSFIAYHPIPVTHGLTVGELAVLFANELELDVDLQVVHCENWQPSQWWHETGLPWIPPSPNLRNPTQCFLYPAIGLLEACNVSVGRGTDQPFELLGAPWLDGVRMARELELPGLTLTPIRFTPDTSKFEGEACDGVYFAVKDRSAVRPVEAGFAIARYLEVTHGEAFEEERFLDRMLSQPAYEAWKRGEASASTWNPDVEAFRQRVGRRAYPR